MYPVPDAWEIRFVREISVMIVLKYGCFQTIGFGKVRYYRAFKNEAKMSGPHHDYNVPAILPAVWV